MAKSLTLAQLRELLHYAPETGVFTWSKPRSGVRHGAQAGMVDRGYRFIRLLGRVYYAHRLAWLYVYGEWPRGQIDHIDGNPSDNRICNLRDATHSQNNMNKRVKRDNQTGLKGVKKYRKRFQARINGDYLGTFDTAEDAHAAYIAAAKVRFGEFARAA